jgi:hypothetical protein
MLRGIDILADAVKVTLGPKGRNVLLDKSFGAPRISKDGVAVAKEIELADRFENIGAQMLKEVAVKTGELAGDGTTTATVLAQAIVHEGAKAVVAGMAPMDLKRGIDMAVGVIVDDVRKRSRKVSTNDEIAQIATISANGESKSGAWAARRGGNPVRDHDFIVAASGCRAAGLAVRGLSRRGRRICDPGGDASPAVGISLADADLRGLRQSRSCGCRSRLAGGCRRCARSDRYRLGGHYWRPAARSGT